MNPVKTIRDHAALKNVDERLLMVAVHKIRPGVTLDHVVSSEVISKAFAMLDSETVSIPSNEHQSTKTSTERKNMKNVTDPDSIERDARQAWDTRPDIRSEFGKFSTYHAYCKYEAKRTQRRNEQLTDNDHRPSANLSDLETTIRHDWDSSADIRSEFAEFNIYRAYVLAESQGRIHTHGNANKRG